MFLENQQLRPSSPTLLPTSGEGSFIPLYSQIEVLVFPPVAQGMKIRAE